MSVLLGFWAALLVMSLLFFERDGAQRVHSLRDANTSNASARRGPLGSFGVLLWGQLRRRIPSLQLPKISDAAASQLGFSISAVLAVSAFKPVYAVALALLLAGHFYLADRSRKQKRLVAIERQLPLVTDLFRVAVGAGMNVTKAMIAVGARVDKPLGPELRITMNNVSRGQRIGDALHDLVTRTSQSVAPLATALASADRHGSPLSVVLERLAFESRKDQERRSEQVAKRLSIQLLFPVAGCTLPAFALLTVAPLLAGSFSSLASSFS